MIPLTIDQRAFIVGEEGVCPTCLKEVSWSDIDTSWYICKNCLGEMMDTEEKTDYLISGYMDGMGDLLRSVLNEMIKRGDPALAVIRHVVKEFETNNDLRI